MSDKEQDDDVGLPKATVFKLIQGPSVPLFLALQALVLDADGLIEMLPADMGCTKEAKEVIVDCCVGE